MADIPLRQLWANRLIFLAVVFAIVVLQLLPLDTRPVSWAPPDVLLAVTLVWISRRPNYVPVTIIAAVFLATDLLFHRPPGLWAALVVLLTETLRNRHNDIRTMPLPLEWFTITIGIVVITFGNRLVLNIMMTPQAPLSLTLMQMVLTVAIYPLAVLVAHFAFGIRRGVISQTIGKGYRI